MTLLHSIFHKDTRSNQELIIFAACRGNRRLDTRRGESWSSSNARLCARDGPNPSMFVVPACP